MDPRHTRTGVRRAAFAAGVVATLLLGALTLAAVASSVSSGADAYVAFSGSAEGAVSVAPPDGSAGPVTSSRSGADLAYASGQASASSGISDGVLVSQAEVSLDGVSLLDGVVQASGIHLVAQAKAWGDGVAGSTAGSSVSGLIVNGEAVDSSQGTVTIDGVGSLSILGALERRLRRVGERRRRGLAAEPFGAGRRTSGRRRDRRRSRLGPRRPGHVAQPRSLAHTLGIAQPIEVAEALPELIVAPATHAAPHEELGRRLGLAGGLLRPRPRCRRR